MTPLARPHFDLIDMLVFVRIVEAESLTRGAENSALSLPAASLRIKNLEEAVGTTLLYRNRRGVSPTPAGEVFLKHARNVLDAVAGLQTEMHSYSHGERGQVRLFANTTAISEYLPEVLASFYQTRSMINIDLQERLSPEIVRAIQDGIGDIGVISTDQADGLETLPFRKNPLVLVVPVGHSLAVHKSLSFSESLPYNFVWLDAHSATHSFLQREIRQFGFNIVPRIKVGNFDAMCRMIEANIGIGVMPEIAARRHGRASLVAIELTDAWATRELRICVRSRGDLPFFARDLLDFLLES